MDESLFSTRWYRLDNLRPQLRAHVELERQVQRGVPWYVLHDPTSGGVHRLNTAGYAFIGRCDGEATVQQIWDAMLAQAPDEAMTQDEVIELLIALHERSLVQFDIAPDVETLFHRQDRRRRARRRGGVNPMAFRMALGDPSRLLTPLYRFVPWLFSGWASAVWLLTVCGAAGAAALHWSELRPYGAMVLSSPGYILAGWLLYPPDRVELARRIYNDVARTLGGQVALALSKSGQTGGEVQRVLVEAQAREPAILSALAVGPDGQSMGQVGEHMRGWRLGPQDPSTVENIRISLMTNGLAWGEVQVVFKPPRPTTLMGWLRDSALHWLVFIVLLGLLVFALYLRRVLRHLDPNAAVPERVRAAFDTLTEGVLVLDTGGRIMLANHAFGAFHEQDPKALTGQEASKLPWLVAAMPTGTVTLPWVQAVHHKRAVLGVPLTLNAPGHPPRELVLNCAPITDGRGAQLRVRGCLASFSDVTELHERTESLRVALAELSVVQQEVERKNEELTILATRDALTGIFNRRSLMHQAEQRFADARANGTPISCIMCDIDHFKLVNDKYGHAGGDQVIQGAAKSLTRGLRLGDFAGRYGGEEFCIMLPGGSAEQAMEIAERLREDIEANLGSSLRDHVGVRVTMSFGVAEIAPDVVDPDMLIDRADQALYFSKKNGRNRATVWTAGLAQMGEATQH